MGDIWKKLDSWNTATPEKIAEMDAALKRNPSLGDLRGNVPKFFREGALCDIYADIYHRSNPRNPELIAGAAIASMSALIGQSYSLPYGPYDKRANSQVIILAPSGAGKDAALEYHSKIVSEVYGHRCYVSTYSSPTVVQARLKDTGFCFDARDEAGDLLKAINSGANTAQGQIGAMIKTLKTKAHSSYTGFNETALKEDAISFHCNHPFYSALSVATPQQFLKATGESDIEGGYWGRVLLFSIARSEPPTNPRLIKRQPMDFSARAWAVVSHFKSLVADKRQQWEDKEREEPYQPEATPEAILIQDAATDYLHDQSEDYKIEEIGRQDYDRIAPIANRLSELACELLLIYTVSKYWNSDKKPIATLEDAKLCWDYALKLHADKLRLLDLQLESVDEKVVRYAWDSCNRAEDGCLKYGTLKTWISRNYKGAKLKDAIMALHESGKFIMQTGSRKQDTCWSQAADAYFPHLKDEE